MRKQSCILESCCVSPIRRNFCFRRVESEKIDSCNQSLYCFLKSRLLGGCEKNRLLLLTGVKLRSESKLNESHLRGGGAELRHLANDARLAPAPKPGFHYSFFC